MSGVHRKPRRSALPDINISELEVPSEIHNRILSSSFEEGEKNIFDRAFYLLTDEQFNLGSVSELLFLSHFAQLRLVLDARFGIAIQEYNLTKEIFGYPADLHLWLSSNPMIQKDSENWYELYSEWVQNLPREILSFHTCDKDEGILLHYLLLDYAVTRDLTYPREEGIGWMPLPNSSDFGYSMKISPARNKMMLRISNFKLRENSIVTEQEADLRLWIPIVVRFQIQYAYMEKNETKNTFHINMWRNSDETGKYTVRKVDDSMIVRAQTSSKGQFALKKPVVSLELEFDNIFRHEPIAWLGFAEIVYLRTKVIPRTRDDLFRNIEEKPELEEGDLAYFILGDYKSGSNGRSASYFGWF